MPKYWSEESRAICVGIALERLLLLTSKFVRARRLPMVVGILPVNLFMPRFKTTRLVSMPRLDGSVLDRLVEIKNKDVSALKLPIVLGKLPAIPLA